jgi:tetratricopeptide (TPR) repeat protein
MNASNFDDSPRLFLPRWLPSELLVGCGDENASSLPRGKISDTFLEHQKDWDDERSLSSAEALVAYAIATQRPIEGSLLRAAQFVVENAPNSLISKNVRDAIDRVVNIESDDDHKLKKLASIRRIVRQYPDSSLLWSDLAYYQCLTGNRESARVSAVIAEKTAVGAPVEILPITRCMVHLGEPDFALRTIRKGLKLHSSAHSVGAEIAISQALGVSPKYFREAARLAASSNLNPKDKALIKASIATEMVNAGADRKAKRLLSDKTLKPDENTLAQLVWLSDRLGLDIDPNSAGVVGAHEAIGRAAYQAKDYATCMKATELWSEFQPFSVTAIGFGSYVAGFLCDDHERSLKMLARGQIVGSNSFTVWNNSAFDYAKTDRLPEASWALQNAAKFADEDDDNCVLSATRGLVLIRRGDIISGEKLYRDAIKGFMLKKDLRSASIASLMFAEELARLGRPDAVILMEEANNLAKEGNHTRVIGAIHEIRKKAIKGFDAPQK